MRRLLLSIFALSALPGSALLAQDITGIWQGTLKVSGPNGSVDLRTVMKISRADKDSLKAVFYSIDQDATPFSASNITLKGSALKVSITALNSVFEGTLGGDGNTISRKWTQVANALPLNLIRATDQTAWTIPEPPHPPAMMLANAKPEFTVATIKPSSPGAPRGGMASGDRT